MILHTSVSSFTKLQCVYTLSMQCISSVGSIVVGLDLSGVGLMDMSFDSELIYVHFKC